MLGVVEMKNHIKSAAKWAYHTTDQIVSKLAEKNYHTARAYYMYQLDLSARRCKESPLIIYQVGKVGSSTIHHSLGILGLDLPIYHVHFLTPELIDEYVEKRKKFLGTEKYGRLQHIWLYQYLRKQIDSGLKGKRWKIVTLTREPIGRNISEFFETIEVKPLDAGSRYLVTSDPDFCDFEIEVDVADLNDLAQVFLSKIDHDAPLRFFDQELKQVFGVDVFSTEFPISTGYKVYEGEQVDVLLIRLENLRDCASDAFKKFLSTEEFTLANANVGSDKAYAPLYRKFRDSIVLPESYVDRMYTSKYMQHFYSAEEIAAFRAKWRIS